MEEDILSKLKSKVNFIQIQATKAKIEEEIEENKKKSLELRKNLDQTKSREAIKSLVLKKQLDQSKTILSESKIL